MSSRLFVRKGPEGLDWHWDVYSPRAATGGQAGVTESWATAMARGLAALDQLSSEAVEETL